MSLEPVGQLRNPLVPGQMFGRGTGHMDQMEPEAVTPVRGGRQEAGRLLECRLSRSKRPRCHGIDGDAGRLVSVRGTLRAKAIPRPIIPIPRTRWSRLSAVLRGTKFARLAWLMITPWIHNAR